MQSHIEDESIEIQFSKPLDESNLHTHILGESMLDEKHFQWISQTCILIDESIEIQLQTY